MNKQLHPLFLFFPALGILVGFSGVSSLHAQNHSTAVSIETIVDRALAENPEIQFYEAEIEAAKAGRRLSGRLGNPELDFNVGRRSSRDGELRGDGVAYAVSVVQPIEWPGRIGLRKAIANGDVQLAQLGLAHFRYRLASEIRQLAFRLSTAQEKAAVAETVAERFDAVKEVLFQREVGGITPRLEIKAIDAATISLEKESLEAAIEVQKVLLEMNQLMGRSAATPLMVKRVEYDFPEPRPLPRLMDLTLANNYTMHIRREELAQQGFRVSLAKNERYPTIKVAPYLSREEALDIEREAGIGFSLELPIFRNGKAEISRQQAREAQAQAMMETTARELEAGVATASLVYGNSYRQLQRWQGDRIEALSEAAELADRHYRLGAVPVSTYIELQKSYLEALEAINDVKADALEAVLQLEQLTGELAPPPSILSAGINETRQPLIARPIK